MKKRALTAVDSIKQYEYNGGTTVSFFMSQYDFGGLERHPANILRLISELEGSYQLCKYMGFEEDMKILDEMKRPYYKLYFKLKKQERVK